MSKANRANEMSEKMSDINLELKKQSSRGVLSKRCS